MTVPPIVVWPRVAGQCSPPGFPDRGRVHPLLAGPPNPEPPVLSRDEADLAAFGYKQRLDRTLGGFSSFAAGFSYLSILTGLPQLFYLGYHAAGPAFFWTWPAVLAGQMLVACCFAELAAEFPLSGGVYQWAKQLSSPMVGWLAGWIALACAVVSMASVALALQGTLPRLAPALQLIGGSDDPITAARNAVLLGCGLIVLTTAINIGGVRLLARINNIGVFAEIVGASLLVILLFMAAQRGPMVVLDTQGTGGPAPLGMLGPLLMAALTSSFVMYGFDTAGSLAEETANPRRLAPRAILGSLASVGLVGGLLILGALMAAPNLADPTLGRLGGGMPAIIDAAIGSTLGWFLLADVTLAIVVCTLTVQAAAVRLIFAMARDNGLPWASALASLSGSARSPRLPAILLGLGALLILVINANSPEIVELLAAVAIVWANLGYLFVTVPQLIRRWRNRQSDVSQDSITSDYFGLGRWGGPINLLAVVWSVGVVVNVGWPRPEIYGDSWYRQYVAVWATMVLLGVGIVYGGWSRRRGQAEVLAEHRAFLPDRVMGRAAEVSEERL